MTARKATPAPAFVCTFPECIHHPKPAPVAPKAPARRRTPKAKAAAK